MSHGTAERTGVKAKRSKKQEKKGSREQRRAGEHRRVSERGDGWLYNTSAVLVYV